jgi:ABC-type multidrug transport system ATPase subunit
VGPEDRLRRIGWAVEVADLAAFVDRRIATYSRGMAQRLALASAALVGEALIRSPDPSEMLRGWRESLSVGEPSR